MDEEVRRDVLRADDYLTRIYADSRGNTVNLFVAFFRSQRAGQTPHSPKNCLPGSGWIWCVSDTIPVSIRRPAAQPIQVNRYVVSKGDDKAVVLYWYQSRDRVVASEYQAAAFTAWDALRYNRTDTALIRVVIPIAHNRDDPPLAPASSSFKPSSQPCATSPELTAARYNPDSGSSTSIVAGAGPAGATAAKFSGRSRRIRRCCSTKAAFPRDKPCGGGISARVHPALPLSRGRAPENLDPLDLESPFRIASMAPWFDYRSSETPLYLMIRRVEFDHSAPVRSRACDIQTNALVRKLTVEADRVNISADVHGQTREYSSPNPDRLRRRQQHRRPRLRTSHRQRPKRLRHRHDGRDTLRELNPAEHDRMYIYYRIRATTATAMCFRRRST